MYSSETIFHDLSAVEYNYKFHTCTCTLENKKKTVWIVKNPEVIIRPLNLTGNFKICMDYIMFHKFTVDNTGKVYDILDEKETYQR